MWLSWGRTRGETRYASASEKTPRTQTKAFAILPSWFCHMVMSKVDAGICVLQSMCFTIQQCPYSIMQNLSFSVKKPRFFVFFLFFSFFQTMSFLFFCFHAAYLLNPLDTAMMPEVIYYKVLGQAKLQDIKVIIRYIMM